MFETHDFDHTLMAATLCVQHGHDAERGRVGGSQFAGAWIGPGAIGSQGIGWLAGTSCEEPIGEHSRLLGESTQKKWEGHNFAATMGGYLERPLTQALPRYISPAIRGTPGRV
jgi:hypothetical protein